MPLIKPCRFAWDPAWAPRLYALSPYLGCSFACNYGPHGCWAAAMAHRFHREPPGGWGNVQPRYSMERLTVGYCLAEEVLDLGPRTILLGATCDPYPPLEKQKGISRFMLQELGEANYHRARNKILPHKILVLTKSPIVCRDWELLKEMGAWVGFSITAPAVVDTQEWEPYAFSNASRIAALKFLHRKGIQVFCSIEPWLFTPTRLWRGWGELTHSVPGYADLTQPGRIIEETGPWVDYFIVGSWNSGGRPKRDLVPYYRAALPQVEEALEHYKPGAFWIKPELKGVLNG